MGVHHSSLNLFWKQISCKQAADGQQIGRRQAAYKQWMSSGRAADGPWMVCGWSMGEITVQLKFIVSVFISA
jgi:hypothetical protein